MTSPATIEARTGRLYGDLWPQYDDQLFLQSLQMFEKRWLANGEDKDFFKGKKCLDVGCGGGRYCFAMAAMGADSVVGVDVSETGLADARRRSLSLDEKRVTFRTASALDLPFPDGTFDFVCCSGVLHHTRGVERGLREIHRVLKGGGSTYLLLYGAGGVFWPLNALLRPLAAIVGQNELEVSVTAAGYAANKRRSVLDDLFVPILETYSRERVEFLLANAGFYQWRFWNSARMDHETDATTLVAELEHRAVMWQAGAAACTDPMKAIIQLHGANLLRSVLAGALDLIEQQRQGRISESEVNAAIVGAGHHRSVATKS